MKNLVLAVCLLGFSGGIDAQEKFQCERWDSYSVLSKYNQLKHLGMDYKFPKGNKEVIPVLIEILKDNGIRQSCIDAAYNDYQNGTESNYRRYINTVKYISKEEYMRNYDYLETFNRMVSTLEQTSNYKRQR